MAGAENVFLPSDAKQGLSRGQGLESGSRLFCARLWLFTVPGRITSAALNFLGTAAPKLLLNGNSLGSDP